MYSFDDKEKKLRRIIFEGGSVTLSDPQEIAYIENLIEKEKASGKREVFTPQEYNELASPEGSFYMTEEGGRIHIKELYKGYLWAIKKGWKPEEVFKVTSRNDRIVQGTLTTGNYEKSINQ